MADESPTEFTSKNPELNIMEAAVGVSSMSAWLVLFLGGILISTDTYRSDIVKEPIGHVKSWAVVLCFYTVTNIAFLCGLSSILGGIYKHLSRSRVNSLAFTPYVIQGFVVFLLLLSGMLVFSDDPFTTLTPTKYVRLAGTASVFSFVAGFNPRLFAQLLEKLEKK